MGANDRKMADALAEQLALLDRMRQDLQANVQELNEQGGNANGQPVRRTFAFDPSANDILEAARRRIRDRTLQVEPTGLNIGEFDRKLSEIVATIKPATRDPIKETKVVEAVGNAKGTSKLVGISQSSVPISRPPGARLDAFASFAFSKRTYKQVLQPCLSETLAEYCEALEAGEFHKAKMVRLRGVLAFWGNVFLQMPVSATRAAQKLWAASGG